MDGKKFEEKENYGLFWNEFLKTSACVCEPEVERIALKGEENSQDPLYRWKLHNLAVRYLIRVVCKEI